MRSRLCALLLAATIAAAPAPLFADEGMWPIDMLDKLPWAELKAMGLQLQPQQIYDGRGHGAAYAVVSLGGGTGSFVSPQGLVLTNHHVAFNAIQRASTAENDYITNGFNAATLAEEVPAAGYRAYVLLGVEDVTKKVLAAVADGMSDLERYRAIEKRIKEIVAEAETGRDVECRVASFYEGYQYKLITNFVVKDVRLVYAPPQSVGNYGGDIDNWMWPRHTGDFSFLRAYVAPNGSSAEYAKDNVPYKPSVWLPMSMKPLKENDFTMIVGFPGRTSRHTTSYGVAAVQDYYYPTRAKIFRDVIAILREEAKRGKDVEIRTASLDQALNNSMKNYEGMLEGFAKSGLLEKKLATEKSFATWLAMNPDMQKKYGDVLPKIGALYEEQKSFRDKSMLVGLMSYAVQLVSAGSIIDRWTEERAKPDLERRPGYQDRDAQRLKMRLRIVQMSYDPRVDRRVLGYFARLAAALPAGQRIEAIDAVLGGATGAEADAKLDAWLDRLYGDTKLGSTEERLRMFGLTREELLAQGDPMMDFAVALGAEARALDERDHALAGAHQRLDPLLMEALMTWKGGVLYPDANATMRLTYGQVKGYRPRDAVSYRYATTLAGVVEKHTGEEPFDCPAGLREIAESMEYGSYEDPVLKDVPVDFLSTCDITGGNSGSPVMNGRGECIGAAFDGNYESIASDYLFLKDTTRSINVDSRYILFIMDRLSGARRLIEEMKVR